MKEETLRQRQKEVEEQYGDILNLPHFDPVRHPRMSVSERAAQFSPFAALTGFEGAVEETARRTDPRIQLDEGRKAGLDRVLRSVLTSEKRQSMPVSVTWFVPDSRKEGGAYRTVTGIIEKADISRRKIYMQDKTEIPLDDLYDIHRV